MVFTEDNVIAMQAGLTAVPTHVHTLMLTGSIVACAIE